MVLLVNQGNALVIYVICNLRLLDYIFNDRKRFNTYKLKEEYNNPNSDL